ncbi:hypothetical protein [Desulfurobacterium sp.]
MVELDRKAVEVAEKLKNKRFFKTLQEKLKNKRLIFTVTTGRSGTGYLSSLFSSLRYVASFHEPEPNFLEAMRKAQQFPHEAVKFLYSKKLPFVASVDEPVYCETSHLFCKGFFYPLLELGILPELIVLKRDKRSVAKSLFELNTIPGRTFEALQFYLKPDDRVYIPLRNWHKLHDYQLCYWYCLEIEKRMEIYSEEVKKRGGKVYEIDLKEILTLEGIVNFFLEMNLPVDREAVEELALKAGVPVNTKKTVKSRSLFDELDEKVVSSMEKEIEEMIKGGK